MPNKNGFTLIELLIVIAIIGILATLLMTNFIGVRQRARDAQRKSDVRQMQSALELYRSDTGSYPASDANNRLNSTACPTSSSFKSSDLTTTYMQTVPCDPLGSTAYHGGNYYYYSTGSSYYIVSCLENSSDSQAVSDADTTFKASSAPDTCTNNSQGTNTYYVVTNP